MTLAVAGPAALGSVRLPAGYAEKADQRLGAGLDHETIASKTPDEAVHVARLSHGAAFELRAEPANGAVGHGLERTSSICARVHCLAAVNGDFFGPHGDIPLGGVVSLGHLLRTPSGDHEQLMVSNNGTPSAGYLSLTATLVTTDLRSLHVDAINGALAKNGVTLYTPAFGRTTATPKNTTEVVLHGRQPIVLSQTSVVSVATSAAHGGNTPIPADGAVLAAHGSGTARLADVINRITNGDASDDALLRVDSPTGAVESIGGGPVLVHRGAAVVPGVHNDFYLGRHPRTIVGWTPGGEILLVTVDGRQPGRSAGMSLAEAAHFMQGLGASEAINLDGGGSTTFVTNGHVVNTPSDRAVRRGNRTVVLGDVASHGPILGYVERPVATALVVVPKTTTRRDDADTLAALPIAHASETPSSPAVAPAGSRFGDAPAIVVPVRSSRTPVALLAMILVALAALAAAMLAPPALRHRPFRLDA